MTRYYCDMCDNEIQEFKTVRLGVGGFGFNEETVRQICDDPKCARESITEMMTIIDSKYTAMRAEISAAKAVE